MNDITERFIKVYESLLNQKKIKSPSDFAKEISVSTSMMNEILKSRSNVGIKVVQNTVKKYPFINIDWLITGKGRMNDFKINEKTVKEPGEEYVVKKIGTPLVNIEAVGGFGNVNFKIEAKDIEDRYVIPDFSNIDFMLRVTGSSMIPKYYSGDIVACRIIKESQFIQWNKVHVISTVEQGVLIKRIKQAKDKNYLIALSDNKDYDPFLIPKEEITGIALVIGTIRLE